MIGMPLALLNHHSLFYGLNMLVYLFLISPLTMLLCASLCRVFEHDFKQSNSTNAG